MSTIVNEPMSEQNNSFFAAVWNWARKIPPVYIIFVVVLIGVNQLNPNFATVNGILAFLRRVSPLTIMALGQLMVIASGGFDLSQGSVVTFSIIGIKRQA